MAYSNPAKWDFVPLIDSFSSYFTSRTIIAGLILFTPFTMGIDDSVLTKSILPVVMVSIAILFFLNYDNILNHVSVLNWKYKWSLALLFLSFFISVLFGLEYRDLTSLTIYNSSFAGVVLDLLINLPKQYMLGFLIFLSIRSLDDLNFLFFTFLLSGVIVNTIAISQLFIPSGFEAARLIGTFIDPNYFGRFEVILICISLCRMLFTRISLGEKIIHFLNILVSFYFLYTSLSRAAFITLALIVSVIVFYTQNKKTKYFAITIILIVLSYFVITVGSKRTGQTSNVSGAVVDYSNTTRLALNVGAFNMFLDYPLSGVGFHNFYNVYINHNYVPENIPSAIVISIVHSWIFSTMAEQGLLGTIPCLILAFLILRDLIRNAKKEDHDGRNKSIALTLFSLNSIIVVFGLFNAIFFFELICPLIIGMTLGYFKIYSAPYIKTHYK